MKKIDVYSIAAGMSDNSNLHPSILLSDKISEHFYVEKIDHDFILNILANQDRIFILYKSKYFVADKKLLFVNYNSIPNKLDLIIDNVHLVSPKHKIIENNYNTENIYFKLYYYVENFIGIRKNNLFFLGFKFVKNDEVPEFKVCGNDNIKNYAYIKLRNNSILSLNEFIFECSHEIVHLILYNEGRVNTYFEEGLAVYISIMSLLDMRIFSASKKEIQRELEKDLNDKYRVAYFNVKNIIEKNNISDVLKLFNYIAKCKKTNMSIKDLMSRNKHMKKYNKSTIEILYSNFD